MDLQTEFAGNPKGLPPKRAGLIIASVVGWGWRSPPSVSPSWCRRSGQGRELCCADSMLSEISVKVLSII